LQVLTASKMAYRQARKDDSSDDEGPTKRVKRNEDDDEERVVGGARPTSAANKKGSGRNVWADVVQEEELTMRSNIMDMNDYRKSGGSTFVKVRRGAESYTVPAAQLEENAAALEAGKHMEELSAPTPSDDPFGDTADLGEVEAFGVGPSSGSTSRGGSGRGNWQSRGGRGRGVRGGWMNKIRSEQSGAPRLETGEEMELGERGDDAMAGGGGQRGGRGRGGWRGAQRGGANRGRGGHWRDGTGEDRKRRWNQDPHAHAKDPAELMDGGYSLAGLLATEFQEGLSPKELGEQIAKAFGERVSDTVVKITEAVGEKKALELFEETKKAEQAGGVKVADGSRRRTPGGVFILLFKSDVDVEPAVKASIFEESKAQFRKTIKARRRNKAPKDVDVSTGLDELQQLLETKKKELQEGNKEEGEATPSPEGGEELDYTEEEESPEGTEME
ncbi:hypothetical protein PENTCL1PPCAC_10167, partial [Pristionchus entomophagus]